ncbi:hypothetical protein GIB67_038933 [Kingdonia uniflora]|uniref:Disease resistance protein n=1 Tax=Kingdonia uniflora TaxID=39325 RepID=A0A7J7LQP6_9MAGN|nr:hypothetical protein GIB67_038933 [Kingdonia uniflora]
MSSSTIRELTIWNCPKLTWTQSCLPPLLETLELQYDAGDLLKEIPASNSLKSLVITYAGCVSLPRGLQNLTSLQELKINNCSILGPRGQKGGEDWNIISQIPNIQVDYKKIHVTIQFCATGLIGLLQNALVNYDNVFDCIPFELVNNQIPISLLLLLSQFDIQDAWNQTLCYNGEEGYYYRAAAAASYEKIMEDNWNVTYAPYLTSIRYRHITLDVGTVLHLIDSPLVIKVRVDRSSGYKSGERVVTTLRYRGLANPDSALEVPPADP